MTEAAAPAPTASEFRAALSGGAKRRLGIQGKTATLALHTDAIEVRGETSGSRRLPFSGIAKLRVGFEESKSRTFLLLRLWLRDEAKPFEFGGDIDRPAYGRFVRATVAAMLRVEPPIAIETGSGLFTPIVVIGVFSTLLIGAAGASIYLAAIGDDWTMPLGALGVLSILLGILGPWVWSRHRPRRIARLEEIERALPGC